jgi:hypothetical protein
MNPRAGGRATVAAMHSKALFPAAILALAAALAVSGCGGGSSGTSTQASSTVTWANGLCTAVTTYRNAVQDAVSKLKGNVSKSSLDDASKSIQSATHTFVDSVQGLGKPDTSAGDQIKKTLDDLSSSLQKDYQTMKDASSGSALSAASAVTTALASAQTQVSSAVADVKKADVKGELQDAFSKASSCSSLTNH